MIDRLLPHLPVFLVILGLLFISIGVLVWSVPLGLAAFGVSCFVLEWRITS